MKTEELQQLFTFVPLAPAELEKVGAIRSAGLAFATEITRQAPDCITRASAIQHVLEAVMLANVSIANSPLKQPKPE